MSTPAVVAAAVKRGYLAPPTDLSSQPYGFYYDLDAYRANMADLRAAFPSHWHHASAVKTNPLSSMLKMALADGHGAECASIGEVLHSLALGFAGPDSRRRDRHFAGTPLSIRIETPPTGRGGCSRMTVSPTA